MPSQHVSASGAARPQLVRCIHGGLAAPLKLSSTHDDLLFSCASCVWGHQPGVARSRARGQLTIVLGCQLDSVFELRRQLSGLSSTLCPPLHVPAGPKTFICTLAGTARRRACAAGVQAALGSLALPLPRATLHCSHACQTTPQPLHPRCLTVQARTRGLSTLSSPALQGGGARGDSGTFATLPSECAEGSSTEMQQSAAERLRIATHSAAPPGERATREA